MELRTQEEIFWVAGSSLLCRPDTSQAFDGPWLRGRRPTPLMTICGEIRDERRTLSSRRGRPIFVRFLSVLFLRSFGEAEIPARVK